MISLISCQVTRRNVPSSGILIRAQSSYKYSDSSNEVPLAKILAWLTRYPAKLKFFEGGLDESPLKADRDSVCWDELIPTVTSPMMATKVCWKVMRSLPLWTA